MTWSLFLSESVKASLIEQDERSPHKYLPAGSIQIGGDTAILCGASDGIYTLEIVDRFNKIYLLKKGGYHVCRCSSLSFQTGGW